jgi:hypothetical protein
MGRSDSKCPPHNYVFVRRDENINPATGRANPIIYEKCSKCGHARSRGI